MQEGRPSWVLLATGGTIAGAAEDPQDHLGYRAGALGAGELLRRIGVGEGVATEEVAAIDSKDMEWEVWRRLAARCAHWLSQPAVRGVVVTHGTDTLEETAWFLQRVLAPAKPLVLASAMRPATALSPDGPQNLADAFTVAQADGARGVLAVSDGAVFAAGEVRKVHPYRLQAFSAGDAGALARVEDARLRILREWPQPRPSEGLLARLQEAAQAPRVEIVHSHAAADGRVVDLLAADGVRGLVVAGTGNGTLHFALESALQRARERGVRVVRSTRCALGSVLPHAGEPFESRPFTPAVSRVDLMLDLLA